MNNPSSLQIGLNSTVMQRNRYRLMPRNPEETELLYHVLLMPIMQEILSHVDRILVS